MFVEQVIWTVAKGQEESRLRLLNSMAQHMDSSGGLVRSLVGNDVNSEQKLISLSFWNSWEDLSRFLRTDKDQLLRQPQNLRMHHYETIWQWPELGFATISGEAIWAIHEIDAQENEVESLLDSLRHFAPSIKTMQGFHTAALWMDKTNYGHVVFATQWAVNMPIEVLQEQAVAMDSIAAGKVTSSICRLKASDRSTAENDALTHR
jgi:heme-degrading monooxygenase HmoA